jgi:hypothetical protein
MFGIPELQNLRSLAVTSEQIADQIADSGRFNEFSFDDALRF